MRSDAREATALEVALLAIRLPNPVTTAVPPTATLATRNRRRSNASGFPNAGLGAALTARSRVRKAQPPANAPRIEGSGDKASLVGRVSAASRPMIPNAARPAYPTQP